jgi:hypothetical protein
MNKNIFIKNKNSDFSNKFNPDVIKKYSDLNQKRNNNKYEFLNKPYKMIIKDKVVDNIESQADLKIDLSENNINVNQNYEKIMNDRKYLDDINKEIFNKKNYKDNKSKFDFRHYQVNKMSNESNDFSNLKKGNKKFYNKQNEELLQEKSKYNDIMNNLIKQGII